MFENSSILITGGTGTFGKRCVEVLLRRYKPERIIVFSRDEFKQSELAREISGTGIRFFIGDVRDKDRLRTAMRGVDYVIHAAALKQVPAAEYNPQEFVKTNILGANNIIDVAIELGIKKVVALSSDKAVNPINLYGATKLAADKLFVAGNNLAGSQQTRFSVIRYGNVLGSRGSFISLIERCLEQKKPIIPITDSRMTRFWLSVDQAVLFVLKSFERMQGGEVFVPKIPSMKTIDIVQALAPNVESKIVGLRPGEKLHEVLVPKELAAQTLQFDDHFVVRPTQNFFQAVQYDQNPIGENGRPVSPDFEYVSDTNDWWMSEEELRETLEWKTSFPLSVSGQAGGAYQASESRNGPQ